MLDDYCWKVVFEVRPLFGVHGANALDHPAPQIFLDPLPGSRFRAFEVLRAELQSVFLVPDPAALGRDPFPGVDRGEGADHRDQIPVALGFDAQHRKAGLLAMEGDPLDQAGDAVLGLLFDRGRHGKMFAAHGEGGSCQNSCQFCTYFWQLGGFRRTLAGFGLFRELFTSS